jgi:Arc/MetJ family transcription regulator
VQLPPEHVVGSMNSSLPIAAVALLVWVLPSPNSWGGGGWLTGPELEKRLGEPVDIVFGENPLREALAHLSRDKNVAILIDRRVDPGRKVEISLHQTPLTAAFGAIAEKCGLEISIVGPVVYFAPPYAACIERTLVALRQDDIGRLPAVAARKLSQPKSMSWDDLAEPRRLLEKLGKEAGVEIAGLDQVPHDLWAAADLPPLSFVERMTLIAGQFNLTFAVSADGNRITLVPVPEKVELLRTYRTGRQAQIVAKKYAALAPQARIQIAGDKILVAGLVEDHEAITAPPESVARSAPGASDAAFASKRYTLKVAEKPIGPLLRQLADQLRLEIRIDADAVAQAGISLDKRVSFSVKNATVDELFRAALEPASLKFTRRGNTIQIEPSQKR